MKCSTDAILFKVSDQPASDRQISDLNIIHMCIVYTAFWHKRALELARILKIPKICMIIIVDLMTLVIDFFTFFKLCIKISGIHLARQIRRTIINPTVFIYLTTEKFTSICSLFAEDLRLFLIFAFLENKGSTLAHCVILGLMETVAAKITDCSKCPAMVVCLHTLCSILNNLKIILLCQFHNFVHLTAHTCIVNRNDCFCFVCDCLLDQIFIDVHSIRTNICKNNPCSSKNKSIRSRNKGIGRHDNLIPRLDIAEEGCHLQCMCTGCCEKNLIYIKPFPHPL